MGTDGNWKREMGIHLYSEKLHLESILLVNNKPGWDFTTRYLNLMTINWKEKILILCIKEYQLSVHDKPLNLAANRITARTSLTPPSLQASIWQYCMALAFRNCLNITLFWHISPVATPIPSGRSACKGNNELFLSLKILLVVVSGNFFSTLGL